MSPRRTVSALGCASLLLGLAGPACLPVRPFDESAWRKTVDETRAADLYSRHRDEDRRFLKPWLLQKKSFVDLLRWRFSRSSAPGADDAATPTVPNDGTYLADQEQPPSVTHVGHATFVVQWHDQIVVTDPFFSERALLPKRMVPPAYGPEGIPAGAVVLVSHNHYDHLDADSIKALAEGRTFLCPLGLGALLRDCGASDVREMDWFESTAIRGTTFTCLPAQHWSRRLGQGYNETLWCSWMMERRQHKVYFGGDSGYFKGFAEFGRRYPGIDVALLGIGAFSPRWFMHYAHMDADETLRAFRDLGARTLIPTQWGVLKLGDEPASWPAKLLEQKAGEDLALRGRVVLLPVGGRFPLAAGQ